MFSSSNFSFHAKERSGEREESTSPFFSQTCIGKARRWFFPILFYVEKVDRNRERNENGFPFISFTFEPT
jgi:hypothetical protein